MANGPWSASGNVKSECMSGGYRSAQNNERAPRKTASASRVATGPENRTRARPQAHKQQQTERAERPPNRRAKTSARVTATQSAQYVQRATEPKRVRNGQRVLQCEQSGQRLARERRRPESTEQLTGSTSNSERAQTCLRGRRRKRADEQQRRSDRQLWGERRKRTLERQQPGAQYPQRAPKKVAKTSSRTKAMEQASAMEASGETRARAATRRRATGAAVSV